MRRSLFAAALVTLLAFATPALARNLCVKGSGVTNVPATCSQIFTDLGAAELAAGSGDDVKIYGTVPVTATVVLSARKLTGEVRAVLDATSLDGVVLHVPSTLFLTDVEIKTSGTPDSIALQVAATSSSSSQANGLLITGPPGGSGVGIDIEPGAGRFTLYGNTRRTVISGLDIGIRALNPEGRLSINGSPGDRNVVIRDVRVGVRSTSTRLAQWFNSEIACGRDQSIGFQSIAEGYDGASVPGIVDFNGLSIHSCGVGLQLECLPGGIPLDPFGSCGGHRTFDNVIVSTGDCPNIPLTPPPPFPPDLCTIQIPCVAIRSVFGDGTQSDAGVSADPGCPDTWSGGTLIDGASVGRVTTSCVR